MSFLGSFMVTLWNSTQLQLTIYGYLVMIKLTGFLTCSLVIDIPSGQEKSIGPLKSLIGLAATNGGGRYSRDKSDDETVV